MADDLDYLRGRRHSLSSRIPPNFVSLFSTNNTVNGEFVTYEVGYVSDDGIILPTFLAHFEGTVFFTFQNDDLYTLWRLIEFFGKVNIRPVESNFGQFFELLSRENPLDEEQGYEETLSEDVLTIIPTLLVTRIPDSLVQFVVEHPDVVPSFLTTFEIMAGTVEWTEEMGDLGILTENEWEALDAVIEELSRRFDTILRAYADQAPIFHLNEDEVSTLTFEDIYNNLIVTLLLMYECIEEEDETSEVLIFVTLFMFWVYQLRIADEDIVSALQILSPAIIAWMQVSGFFDDVSTDIIEDAVNLLPGIIAGRRRRIILYDHRI